MGAVPPERDLEKLLASLAPEIRPGTYGFCTVDEVPETRSIMRFEESEGTTLVVSVEDAERVGLAYDYPASGS